jgi:hypothetical protein
MARLLREKVLPRRPPAQKAVARWEKNVTPGKCRGRVSRDDFIQCAVGW